MPRYDSLLGKKAVARSRQNGCLVGKLVRQRIKARGVKMADNDDATAAPENPEKRPTRQTSRRTELQVNDRMTYRTVHKHSVPGRGTRPSKSLSAQIARHARETSGLSQRALAVMLGLSQSFISRVLKGEKNFSLESLLKMAQHLEIPISVLIWRSMGKPTDVTEEDGAILDRIDELMHVAYPEHVRADERDS